MADTKRCSRCREEKPEEAWSPSNWAKPYRSPGYCMACHSAYNRANARARQCKRCGVTFERWDTYEHPGSAATHCRPCYNEYSARSREARMGPKRVLKQPQPGCNPQGKIWNDRRAQVFAEETHCWLCGEWVDQTLKGTTARAKSIDHVVPQALGGSHDRDNLRLAHCSCNCRRGQALASDVTRALQRQVDELLIENARLRAALDGRPQLELFVA